jgi:hypothetical protein
MCLKHDSYLMTHSGHTITRGADHHIPKAKHVSAGVHAWLVHHFHADGATACDSTIITAHNFDQTAPSGSECTTNSEVLLCCKALRDGNFMFRGVLSLCRPHRRWPVPLSLHVHRIKGQGRGTEGTNSAQQKGAYLQKSADSSCFVFFASSELVPTWVGVDPIVAAQCMCVYVCGGGALTEGQEPGPPWCCSRAERASSFCFPFLEEKRPSGRVISYLLYWLNIDGNRFPTSATVSDAAAVDRATASHNPQLLFIHVQLLPCAL